MEHPEARCARTAAILLMLVAAAPRIAAADCTLTSTDKTPLNDLGSGLYLGTPGGLYPGSHNTRPPDHLATGLNIALNHIKPRSATGAIDLANGRIVLVSIGISNTSQEFQSGGSGAFVPRALGDLARSPRVTLVDCAQGGHSAAMWADQDPDEWNVMATRIANAGASPAQVQVAWIKHAELLGSIPDTSYPAHVQWHQDNVADVLRTLRTTYPNLKLAFLSSRTRAWRVNTGGNPEPFTYEYGFAVRNLIELQMTGQGDLNHDETLGPAVAPFLTWGPYLWIDGDNPRSDGLTWPCADVNQSDFSHPSATGVTKVGDQLTAMFRSDPLAAPWYLRSGAPLPLPTCSISTGTTGGVAPLTVNLTAVASDPGGSVVSYSWMFDDGCYSIVQNPTKTYPVPGRYTVRLTAADNQGGTAIAAQVICVLDATSALADLNVDGHVNLLDHAAQAACMAGPGAGTLPGCSGAGAGTGDLDDDGDVDLRDAAAMQRAAGTCAP